LDDRSRVVRFWYPTEASALAFVDMVETGEMPPPANKIEFAFARFIQPEGDGDSSNIAITVTRPESSAGEVSVDYTTSDGSAESGSDYTAISGTLTWADGDASDKTLLIPVAGDTIPEVDETFTLTLSNPTGGAVLGSVPVATVSIPNDDGVLLAYALDIEYLDTASINDFPRISTDSTTPGGPWITFTYRKNEMATDLIYSVQNSADLIEWTEVMIDNANTFSEIADPDPDGDSSSQLMRVRLKDDPATYPARFLRLHVSPEY
jgi:hypothetical protein